MSPLLQISVEISLGILLLALALGITRLLRGPSIPDRVVALDVIATLVVGILSLLSIQTGLTVYLTAGITLALLAFLGTVALALYIQRGGPP